MTGVARPAARALLACACVAFWTIAAGPAAAQLPLPPTGLPQVQLPSTSTPPLELPEAVPEIVRDPPLQGLRPAQPAPAPTPTVQRPGSGAATGTRPPTAPNTGSGSRRAPATAPARPVRRPAPVRPRRPAASRPSAAEPAVARGRRTPQTLAIAGQDRPASRAAERSRSLPSRLTDAIGSAPWPLLAAAVALAVLGLAMAGRSMLATARGRRLHQQRQELRRDVSAMQSALLPAPPSTISGVGVSVAFRSAQGPAAGGDFHDVLALDHGRVGVIVGDVSGHGRDALAVTPLVHYTVRAYLEAGLAPRQALRLADRTLDGKLGDDFATVLAATYDPAASVLTYATAGHPAPVVTGARDRVTETMTPAPLALGPLTGFRQSSIPIGPGSRICFFSDGLIEARRDADDPDLLGRAGLAELLAGADPAIDAPGVLDLVSSATTAGRDDMTVCLLDPEHAAGHGPVVEEIELPAGADPDARMDAFLTGFGLDQREAAAAVSALTAATDGPRVLRLERDAGDVRWSVEASPPPARQLTAAI